MTDINKFLSKYDKYDRNKWDKSTTNIIVYGFANNNTYEDIYEALQNVPPILEQKLSNGRLNVGSIKIIREIYGDEK